MKLSVTGPPEAVQQAQQLIQELLNNVKNSWACVVLLKFIYGFF
jgi:hypothetical protein